MPTALETQLAAQAANTAGSLVDTGLGIALAGWNDKRQIRQQDKLTQLQVNAQKQLTDYNYSKQLEMWNATNYGAQMEQLKKAGLNPALVYGMGGGGGSTTGSSGSSSVGSGTAPSGGGEIMGMLLGKAQLGLIEAQTKKTEAEANKTAGVDTDLAKATIGNLAATTTNTEAKTKLAALDQQLKQLQITYDGATLDDRIDRVNYEVRNMIANLQKVQNEVYINRETREAQIQIVEREAIGALLRNSLTGAQIANTKQSTAESEARIQKMAVDIEQGWTQLGQGETKLAIDKFKAEFEANYPDVWKSAGRLLEDGITRLFETVRTEGRQQLKNVQTPQKH